MAKKTLTSWDELCAVAPIDESGKAHVPSGYNLVGIAVPSLEERLASREKQLREGVPALP